MIKLILSESIALLSVAHPSCRMRSRSRALTLETKKTVDLAKKPPGKFAWPSVLAFQRYVVHDVIKSDGLMSFEDRQGWIVYLVSIINLQLFVSAGYAKTRGCMNGCV